MARHDGPRQTGDSRFVFRFATSHRRFKIRFATSLSEIRAQEKKRDLFKQANQEAIAVIVPRSPMDAPMPTGRDGACRVSPVSSRRRARARRFRAKRNHEFEEAKSFRVDV